MEEVCRSEFGGLGMLQTKRERSGRFDVFSERVF